MKKINTIILNILLKFPNIHWRSYILNKLLPYCEGTINLPGSIYWPKTTIPSNVNLRGHDESGRKINYR